MFTKKTMQKDARYIAVKDIQSCWFFLLTMSKSNPSLKILIKSRKIDVTPKLLPSIMSFKKPTKNKIKYEGFIFSFLMEI